MDKLNKIELDEIINTLTFKFYGNNSNNNNNEIFNQFNSTSGKFIKDLILNLIKPKISINSTELINNNLLNNLNLNNLNIKHSLINNNFLKFLKYFENNSNNFIFTDSIKNQLINNNNKDNSNNDILDYNLLKLMINDYTKLIDKLISSSNITINDKLNLKNSIYLKILSKFINNNKLNKFEFINHPILEINYISSNDKIEDILSLIDYSNINLPNWIDLNTQLTIFNIIVNLDNLNEDELNKAIILQNLLKDKYNLNSIILKFKFNELFNDNNNNNNNSNETELIKLLPSISISIEDELINLNDYENFKFGSIEINKKFYELINNNLNLIYNNNLLPFINKKLKLWINDIILPKKSFTNRLFKRNPTKKFTSSFFSFNSSNSNDNNKDENNTNEIDNSILSGYIENGGYYNAKSNEMLIRKLSDWYFLLKDYKNAYSNYEILKKDILNDKSYLYLSSTQEYMNYSLLLGSINKINPYDNNNNNNLNSLNNIDSGSGNGNGGGIISSGITNKIINDIITPNIDSIYYNYNSRLNLKNLTIRSILLTSEFYLILGQFNSINIINSTTTTANINNIKNSNSLIYFNQSIKLFNKLIDSNLIDDYYNSKIMNRISFIYDNYSIEYENLSINFNLKNDPLNSTIINDKDIQQDNEEKEEEIINKFKIYDRNEEMDIIGLTRKRKSLLWLILSIKNIDPVIKPIEFELIIKLIQQEQEKEQENNSVNGNKYELSKLSWINRDDCILHKFNNLINS